MSSAMPRKSVSNDDLRKDSRKRNCKNTPLNDSASKKISPSSACDKPVSSSSNPGPSTSPGASAFVCIGIIAETSRHLLFKFTRCRNSSSLHLIAYYQNSFVSSRKVLEIKDSGRSKICAVTKRLTG